MNVPADHVAANAEAEDRESGGVEGVCGGGSTTVG